MVEQIPMKQGKYLFPIAALLLLLVFSSPATFGADSDVRVVSQKAEGSTVTVTVANDGDQPKTVFVRVAAVVNGETVIGATGVTVMDGASANATVGFSSTVEGTKSLGIDDAQNPF